MPMAAPRIALAPALSAARATRFAPAADDAELVRRALEEDDSWAREALFRRYIGDVVALVRRLLGRRDEADDIVQETMAAALGDLASLRDRDAFRSWLLGIAVRRVRRAHRRRSVRRFFGIERGEDDASLYDCASSEASPEMLTELALIDAAIARLPVDDRIAWMLRRVEGEPLEEIAQITGVSLSTVKRRIDAVDVRVRAHLDRGGRP
jgi:RNA polymerase sigma-70 factor, ECF subfamily